MGKSRSIIEEHCRRLLKSGLAASANSRSRGEYATRKQLAAAEVLEAREPRNRDVLYLIAANLRCLSRVPEALQFSQRLEQHHPRFSLMYQERGHCYATLRDLRRAIDALRAGGKHQPRTDNKLDNARAPVPHDRAGRVCGWSGGARGSAQEAPA